MKDILIHYGVKGMKWGVRKQYEGTGGGGGGDWGPNTVAGGGGPSPLAASMAGNPKKKKSVGKAEAEKMGVQDRKKTEREKARQEGEKAANDYARSIAELGSLGDALNKIVDAGIDPPEDLVNKYNKAFDHYLEMNEKVYGNEYYMANFDIVEKKGKAYITSKLYSNQFDDVYEGIYEMPELKFTEKK